MGFLAFLAPGRFDLWIIGGDTAISSFKYPNKMAAKSGPGGGSRTHTGSDPRQILSLLRLPVPPLRENSIENSMSEVWGKGAGRAQCDEKMEVVPGSLRCAARRAKRQRGRNSRAASVPSAPLWAGERTIRGGKGWGRCAAHYRRSSWCAQLTQPLPFDFAQGRLAGLTCGAPPALDSSVGAGLG